MFGAWEVVTISRLLVFILQGKPIYGCFQITYHKILTWWVILVEYVVFVELVCRKQMIHITARGRRELPYC